MTHYYIKNLKKIFVATRPNRLFRAGSARMRFVIYQRKRMEAVVSASRNE
jgi:hypothetical protein